MTQTRRWETMSGGSLREACRGLRRLLGRRPAGSPRRAATTPGEGLGEACEGLRRLLLLGEACEGSRQLLLERAWGSLRRAAATTSGGRLRKPAKGRGDYSWGEPGGSSRRVAATTPGGRLRKPAMGCGDYSWRKSGEAREGLRRLLLEKAWGSLRRAAAASVSPKVIDTLCKEYLRPGK